MTAGNNLRQLIIRCTFMNTNCHLILSLRCVVVCLSPTHKPPASLPVTQNALHTKVVLATIWLFLRNFTNVHGTYHAILHSFCMPFCLHRFIVLVKKISSYFPTLFSPELWASWWIINISNLASHHANELSSHLLESTL